MNEFLLRDIVSGQNDRTRFSQQAGREIVRNVRTFGVLLIALVVIGLLVSGNHIVVGGALLAYGGFRIKNIPFGLVGVIVSLVSVLPIL